MDFKINREVISHSDIVYDGTQEQSVELDYVMPDYYPDIFKLVKCMLCPSVVSHSLSGDKLTYELLVKIKVLYCSDESNEINCVDQRMTFTKTVDFGGSCENADITFSPVVDYVNCRAVNQRRLDVRGAVSIKIKAGCEKTEEIVSDAFGSNIQLRKENVFVVGTRMCKECTFEVDEDIDISYSKPAIRAVILADAVNINIDRKIIANKLITKGEAKVNFLYNGDDSPETMEFTVPYSQVIDIDGLDDSYDCDVSAKIVCCEVTPHNNDDGEMRTVNCKLLICVKCRAYCTKNILVVADAYSTKNECECTCSQLEVETEPVKYSDTTVVKSEVKSENGNLSKIYDVRGYVRSCTVSCDKDEGKLRVTGTVSTCVTACSDDGKPFVMDNEAGFEHIFDVGEDNIRIRDCCAEVLSVSYSLPDSERIEIKTEVKISICASKMCNRRVVTDITVDPDTIKESEGYALKIYFADEGEDLWNIAKKYSTSVDAIIEENELDTDNDGARMLLIPIVS